MYMFYKLLFKIPIEYDKLSQIDDLNGFPIETQTNQYTGYDSVIYSNSQIDLLINNRGEIEGLQICNECTKTYNIESHLLLLAYQLIENSFDEVEVFDGSGFTETLDKDSLKEYCAN